MSQSNRSIEIEENKNYVTDHPYSDPHWIRKLAKQQHALQMKWDQLADKDHQAVRDEYEKYDSINQPYNASEVGETEAFRLHKFKDLAKINQLLLE